MSQALPTVVIVGRPNVGKSTLFNRITGQRRAIVGDEPGITRDRLHGQAEHDGRRFELIDTGGIVVDDRDYIPAQILHQAEVALRTASHIIFLVDGRSEITAPDRDLARMLQKLGKPVSLAVNKIDTVEREGLANDFYSLGIADVFPVSSEHGTGVYALLDRVTGGFPAQESPAAAEAETKTEAIKVAIIGRPNVGKSTLLTPSPARSAPSFRRSPAPRATPWTSASPATARTTYLSIPPAFAARAKPATWPKS